MGYPNNLDCEIPHIRIHLRSIFPFQPVFVRWADIDMGASKSYK